MNKMEKQDKQTTPVWSDSMELAQYHLGVIETDFQIQLDSF